MIRLSLLNVQNLMKEFMIATEGINPKVKVFIAHHFLAHASTVDSLDDTHYFCRKLVASLYVTIVNICKMYLGQIT